MKEVDLKNIRVLKKLPHLPSKLHPFGLAFLGAHYWNNYTAKNKVQTIHLVYLSGICFANCVEYINCIINIKYTCVYICIYMLLSSQVPRTRRIH